MNKILILALAASALAGCASQAEWARTDPRAQGDVVQAAFANAQLANCRKLKAAGAKISPEGAAICKRLGA